MTDLVNPPSQPSLSELGLDLLLLSKWQITRLITLPAASFAAYWVLASRGFWIPAVFSLVVLSFVTYGSTSHDLVHGNLRLPRLVNDILLSILELVAIRSGHAYQAAHLHHHARFPHVDDVEAAAARMKLTRALLEGLIFQMRVYCWALKNARGWRNWIVAEGGIIAITVIGAILLAPYTLLPVVYVGLMIAGSWTIPLITSYLPHDPHATNPLHQTRLFRGWLARICAFEHLYHLEHHLYPAVPHQNWPKLAQRLDPWFEQLGIRPVRLG